jgi:hypothetical protein
VSKWQPARYIDFHGQKHPSWAPIIEAMKRTRIFIGHVEPFESTLAVFREIGCDAKPEEFYELSPGDSKRLKVPTGALVFCKHEILTD